MGLFNKKVISPNEQRILGPILNNEELLSKQIMMHLKQLLQLIRSNRITNIEEVWHFANPLYAASFKVLRMANEARKIENSRIAEQNFELAKRVSIDLGNLERRVNAVSRDKANLNWIIAQINKVLIEENNLIKIEERCKKYPI